MKDVVTQERHFTTPLALMPAIGQKRKQADTPAIGPPPPQGALGAPGAAQAKASPKTNAEKKRLKKSSVKPLEDHLT